MTRMYAAAWALTDRLRGRPMSLHERNHQPAVLRLKTKINIRSFQKLTIYGGIKGIWRADSNTAPQNCALGFAF